MTREFGLKKPVWQEQFFDHVLRSSESYSQKWDYVRENRRAQDWSQQRKIGRGKAKSSC